MHCHELSLLGSWVQGDVDHLFAWICHRVLCMYSYLLRSLPSCFTGQALTLQAGGPDEQASKHAAYLQTEAGKQQLESASGFGLSMGVSLMGLPQYGRQLYVRPSYLQLRRSWHSFPRMQVHTGTKLSWSAVPLALANHSALYTQPPILLLKAQGLYTNSTLSVHQPTLLGIISHPTATRLSSAINAQNSNVTQMILILCTL